MVKAFILSFVLITFSCKDKDAIGAPSSDPNSEVTAMESQTDESAVKTAASEAEIEPEVEEKLVNSEKSNNVSKTAKGSKTTSKPKKVNNSAGEEGQITTEKEKPELPPVYKNPKPKPTDDVVKNEDKEPEVKVNASFDHSDFDKVLSNYVSVNGKVNYNGLKANRSTLDNYTKSLSENPPTDEWSKNEKLAYWINAYNAFTITKIINNYPLESIKDLDGGKPWDVKWINIGNKTYSLNNIENDIIRPKFNDPRIHFAVNCAAKSCPPLLNKAYTADNLNGLLNSNTKKFINNSNFNELSGDQIKISKIFDWYGSDFGDIIAYLNKYANQKVNQDAKIGFMDYNWALNN